VSANPVAAHKERNMQKLRVWGLLAMVLSLDGLAGWAMLDQHDLRLSLVCVAVNVGVLLASSHLWRWGHER
jgi:hypothetical protein